MGYTVHGMPGAVCFAAHASAALEIVNVLPPMGLSVAGAKAFFRPEEHSDHG